MGVPPPPDAPDVPTQDAVSLSASFETSPSGFEICGFKIPGFSFSLNFSIPFPSFDFPPMLFFSIALTCDLANPIQVEGRVGDLGLDADPEFG